MKVKKLRSIKLARVPSLKLATRQPKLQSDYYLSIWSSDDAASSQQSTPTKMSDTPPHYMKTTTSSDAKKEGFQTKARILTRGSSFKPARSLTRLSSTKFRRSLMRKSSGGTELKKKLKKSRSIRPANQFSIVSSRDAHTSSANYLKVASRSDVRNVYCQASPHNSKSTFSSDDEKTNPKMNLASNGNKSLRVMTRTSTLRPVRVLTKMASLRTRRPSVKKCTQIPDSGMHRATCSSALKDSKLPDHLELQPEGSESEGISAMKVCPYSYCSLHGPRHSALPPLKRFVSMRRRLLKNQKIMQSESQSSRRTKHSSNTKKGIRTSQMAPHKNPAVLDSANDGRGITSIREMARTKVDFNGESTRGSDSKDISNSVSSAEVALGEASYPCLYLKESLQEINEFSTEERSSEVPCPVLMTETSVESCCTRTEADELSSEATVINRKEEGIMASNSHTEGHRCIISVDHSEDEEIPVGGKAQQEVHEDRISSLNLDVYKDDSEANNSEANTMRSAANERINKSKIPTPDRFVESGKVNNMVSSAAVSEPPEQAAASEGKNQDSVKDYQFLTADSGPDCSTDMDKTPREKPKHMGLWHLIYQHMVSGIASEDGTWPTLAKVEKEEQGEDVNMLSGMNKSGSSPNFSVTDQSMGVEEQDGDSPKMQLYQQDAINLVREAFDRILSEIPDQSSDDQLIKDDPTSYHEHAENNHSEGRELSVSSSSDAGKETVVQDAEGMRLSTDENDASEGNKAESKVESKSNQQTPKSWSYLKKIIILKRFVRALEKVRNFNPQQPQYLPIKPDPEMEKVHLRHQTKEERKNSEEWMLDYALQKVISTLAPAQKQKVALLVQAFETVIPLPEVGTSPRSDVAASSLATSVETCNGSLEQKGSQEGRETSFRNFLCRTSGLGMSLKENHAQVNDFCTAEEYVPTSFSELKEASLEIDPIQEAPATSAYETTAADSKEEASALSLVNGDNDSILKDEQPFFVEQCVVELAEPNLSDKPSINQADILRTSQEEFLINGEVLQEVHDCDFGFNGQKLESDSQIHASGEQSDESESQIPKTCEESFAIKVVPLASVSETLESFEDTEQQSQLIEESDASCTTSVTCENHLEKQKYTRLWYLIYKHMLSGSATLLEADKEEQGDDAHALIGMNNDHSHQDFTVANQDINMKNQDTGGQKIELQQIEAIKLVEEAIDEIPLPETQDDSLDDQSVSSEILPDLENLEKKPVERGEPFVLASTTSIEERFEESNNKEVEQSTMEDPQDPWVNSDNITAQEKAETVSKAGNKPKPSMRKSWSNLKKLILLKRFIKALEKVKEFDPQEPQVLPLGPEKEKEEVCLRHQHMEDTKNADEWMLDYALQQVVTKLTPIRMRKVALLVEAFESVTPTIKS